MTKEINIQYIMGILSIKSKRTKLEKILSLIENAIKKAKEEEREKVINEIFKKIYHNNAELKQKLKEGKNG